MLSAMVNMFRFNKSRRYHPFQSASDRNELGNALSHKPEMTTVVLQGFVTWSRRLPSASYVLQEHLKGATR